MEALRSLARAVAADSHEWSMVASALATLPIVVFIVDATGVIRWFGGALPAQLGFAHDALVGTNLGDWGVPYWSAICAAGQAGVHWPQSWRWPGRKMPGTEWLAVVDQITLENRERGYVILGARLDNAIPGAQ